jgi:predicted branched-subunit amino acid permease
MKSLHFAIKKMVPLLFSYIFVGIASGLLLYDAGYSPVWAFISGMFIYAGSMQIVMVSLMTAGTPLIWSL